MPVAKRALVVVVQPSGGGQREVTPAVLDRCWKEALGVLQQQGAAEDGQVGAWAISWQPEEMLTSEPAVVVAACVAGSLLFDCCKCHQALPHARYAFPKAV